MQKNEKYASGLWKFHDSVKESALIEQAKEWSKDDRFINLYIRKCRKDQFGIGFTYKYTDLQDAGKEEF